MSDPISSEERLAGACNHPECKDKVRYSVNAGCKNCGWNGRAILTKGHEFSGSLPCPRCGCTFTLMRQL